MQAIAHTGMRPLNLLLAVLAAACVIAALAGSMAH